MLAGRRAMLWEAAGVVVTPGPDERPPACCAGDDLDLRVAVRQLREQNVAGGDRAAAKGPHRLAVYVEAGERENLPDRRPHADPEAGSARARPRHREAEVLRGPGLDR